MLFVRWITNPEFTIKVFELKTQVVSWYFSHKIYVEESKNSALETESSTSAVTIEQTAQQFCRLKNIRAILILGIDKGQQIELDFHCPKISKKETHISRKSLSRSAPLNQS